ncbi:hypothetical protein TEHD23766T_2390 [Tetragenococcus halophilus subsp. flandriensis]|nr:hypothetical protein TEHD23766T_2390 [Tetragenococcus halophilus subsp. flandriensis]
MFVLTFDFFIITIIYRYWRQLEKVSSNNLSIGGTSKKMPLITHSFKKQCPTLLQGKVVFEKLIC